MKLHVRSLGVTDKELQGRIQKVIKGARTPNLERGGRKTALNVFSHKTVVKFSTKRRGVGGGGEALAPLRNLRMN